MHPHEPGDQGGFRVALTRDTPPEMEDVVKFSDFGSRVRRLLLRRRELPHCTRQTRQSVGVDAVRPETVAAVMEPLGLWWAIAGGWAIDLWLGETTRDHHDVEVVVQRQDQTALQAALGDWKMTCIDPPGSHWRPWPLGEVLTRPTFQAKAQHLAVEFDVFLEDVEQGAWSFRRDRGVRRPVEDLVVTTPSALRVVSPEVQLLYMARHAGPKNDHDLLVALPRLSESQRTWLRETLNRVEPHHRWLSQLAPP